MTVSIYKKNILNKLNLLTSEIFINISLNLKKLN